MGTATAGWDATEDGAALAAALEGAGFVIEPPDAVSSTVLDTFDGRLHDAGLRLEHRAGALVLDGRDTVPARLDGVDPPRFAEDLPRGPLRQRLAELLEVRALLPLVTVSAVVRRAQRHNAEGKVVASARLYDEIATDRGAVQGRLVEVDELTGYEKQAGEARAVLASTGTAFADEGDAVSLALAAARVDLTGHHDEPTVPLDPGMPAIDGFRLVLANLLAPSTPTCPARSRTSIPSSSTTCASPFAGAARCCATARGCSPRTSTRGATTTSNGWARSPVPRATSTCSARSGPATSPPCRTVDGAVLAPVRAQIARRSCGRPRRLSAELVSAPVVELLARWRTWLASGEGTPGPRGERRLLDVVVKEIDKAEAPPARARAGDHPGDARRGRPRAAQGRQAAALPPRVLRRPAPVDGAQGVRQAAQGVAGQPRRAPGRRGARRQLLQTLAGELPAPPMPRRSSPSAGWSSSSSIGAPRRRDEFAEPLRRLRQQGDAPGAAGRCSTVPAGEGPRHLQHQGRRREDHRGREPRRPRPARAGARVLLWDLDPQGAATFFVRVKPAMKGGAEQARRRPHGVLADHVRASDIDGMHVLPADFSLRHLDLHLDRADRRPPRRAARSADGLLRRRPAGLPAGHHADQRRACSVPPMRCSCRRSPRRSRAARSTSWPRSSPPSTTRRSCCRSSR